MVKSLEELREENPEEDPQLSTNEKRNPHWKALIDSAAELGKKIEETLSKDEEEE